MKYPWAVLPREELLDLRLCDLDLRLRGSWVELCIDRLSVELQQRDLRIRAHCWLSEEWFCPQGICGIAIPFYLAHPRLRRLEHVEVKRVEGGSRRECLRLLRHEMGHAIQGALKLHRRRRWRELFGRSTVPYPDEYQPDPSSRNYVQYLDYWYAQSHPIEDFAETFAVWLDPRSRWRRRYRDWPALEKLAYVDELMDEFKGRRIPRLDRTRIEEIRSIHKTLRQYYSERHQRYGETFPDHFDTELLRVFTRHTASRSAALYLLRNRRRVRQRAMAVLGDEQYLIDMVYRELIGRTRALDLRVADREGMLEEVAMLVAVCVTRRLYDIREWYKM